MWKKKNMVLAYVFVVLALTAVVQVAATSSDIFFVDESGTEIPFEDFIGLTTMELPNATVFATFMGAILGVFGSTFLPWYLRWRKDKRDFNYSYLYNAVLSAVAVSLTMLSGLPPTTPVWLAGVLCFLSVSGTKKFGDSSLDAMRKE